jgi:hypothetical protein
MLNPKWDSSARGESPSVMLRDGLDYRVDVSDVDVGLTHLQSSEVWRIPWDVEGNKVLLSKMQDRFPDLDNRAIIESAGMLHGLRQLWPPTGPKG